MSRLGPNENRWSRLCADPADAPALWAVPVVTLTTVDGGELVVMADQDGETFIVDPVSEAML